MNTVNAVITATQKESMPIILRSLSPPHRKLGLAIKHREMKHDCNILIGVPKSMLAFKAVS